MEQNREQDLPRYGYPERYIGKTVSEVGVAKTHDGDDRLVIRFEGTDDYLDIRAGRLFY